MEQTTLYTAHQYTVTDTEIKATGKMETYEATTRAEAVNKCLYTHRLHNGNAISTARGVIHCPTCGQMAITTKPASHETQTPTP